MLKHIYEVKRGSTFLRGRGRVSTKSILTTQKTEDPEIPVSDLLLHLLQNSTELRNLLAGVHQQPLPEKETVINLRGRPPETFQDGFIEADKQSLPREELFHLTGTLIQLPSSLEDSPQNPLELPSIPFSYGINSLFEQYLNNGSIVHSLAHCSSGLPKECLPRISPLSISMLFPLTVEKARLGFELYQTKIFGGMFGRVARVESRFYLEIEKREISIFSEQNALGQEDLPLDQIKLSSYLDRSLNELALYDSYQQDLKTRHN